MEGQKRGERKTRFRCRKMRIAVMTGINRTWEERSSWKERLARRLNAFRKRRRDRSQMIRAAAFAGRPVSHRPRPRPSVLLVASVVLMVPVIKMIAGFYAIEHNAHDVLFPEQLYGLLYCLAGSLSGPHH